MTGKPSSQGAFELSEAQLMLGETVYELSRRHIAPRAAMKAAVDGVQVLGGAGYMKDHPLERFMRDAKQLQIIEGTNQIQRMVIAQNLLSL